MFKVDLFVSLKKQVLDPQGLTVKHALESLGYKDVEEVRMGKFIEIKLSAKDKTSAEEEVKAMCEKLLVNPTIEEFSYKIKKNP